MVLAFASVPTIAMYIAAISMPFERLVGWFTADDMYYYLTIARHLAAGDGSTFDGVQPTNGFHPLWAAVLTVLTAAMGPHDIAIVRMALTLLAVCSVATGALLAHSIGRTLGPWSGVAAAVIWWWNPWVVATTLSGVEAGLGALLVAVVLDRALFAIEAPELTNAILVQLGLAIGLAVLARTDGLLYGSLALALVTASVSHAARRRMWIPAAAAAAAIAPWIIWCLASFGRVAHDSARALFALHWAPWWNAGHQASEAPAEVAAATWAWFKNLDELSHLPPVLVIGAAMAGLLWAARASDTPRTRRVTVALSSGHILGCGLAYGAYGFQQDWYFLAPLVSTTVLLTHAARALSNLASKRTNVDVRAWLGLLTTLTVAGPLGNLSNIWNLGAYPWQCQYYSLALDLRQSIPTDVPLGSFNAGIYGYFSGHRVVDLDGVVNAAALDALKHHQLLAYMRSAQVQVLVDHEAIINHFADYAEADYTSGWKILESVPNDSHWGNLLVLWRPLEPVVAAPTPK